jgi:hypothetical protein
MTPVNSMSAMCFYFGVELTKTHPDMPVGMIGSSWGATDIEVCAVQPHMTSVQFLLLH